MARTPNNGLLCHHSKFIPEITDEGVMDLYKLIEIVFNSHFLYIKDEYLKEDMEGSAMVKMLEYIKSGVFDPNRGSLKNVLYTCCRNEMKNVIYRSSKATPVEEDVMASNESPQLTVSMTSITFNEVKIPRMTREDCGKVESNLRNMGFIVPGGTESVWYPEMERWTTYVIHRRLNK